MVMIAKFSHPGVMLLLRGVTLRISSQQWGLKN